MALACFRERRLPPRQNQFANRTGGTAGLPIINRRRIQIIRVDTNKRSGRTHVEHRTHHSRTRTKQIIFLSEHNIEHRTSEHRTPNTEHGQPWAVHGQQLVDQLLVDQLLVDQQLVDQYCFHDSTVRVLCRDNSFFNNLEHVYRPCEAMLNEGSVGVLDPMVLRGV